MVKTKMTWDTAKLNQIERNLFIGMINLGGAVAKAQKGHAAVESGALVNSIIVQEKNSKTVVVTAGGGKVPYARRRNFENKLHPTTMHYFEHGAEDVLRGDITKFFRWAVK